ncbi:hypothetical protein C8R44DRAFT_749826 [Mycena epipterygia]|nr:hypothetical protein C8R44DRAFT_749826 [Mycena epipterygia]
MRLEMIRESARQLLRKNLGCPGCGVQRSRKTTWRLSATRAFPFGLVEVLAEFGWRSYADFVKEVITGRPSGGSVGIADNRGNPEGRLLEQEIREVERQGTPLGHARSRGRKSGAAGIMDRGRQCHWDAAERPGGQRGNVIPLGLRDGAQVVEVTSQIQTWVCKRRVDAAEGPGHGGCRDRTQACSMVRRWSATSSSKVLVGKGISRRGIFRRCPKLRMMGWLGGIPWAISVQTEGTPGPNKGLCDGAQVVIYFPEWVLGWSSAACFIPRRRADGFDFNRFLHEFWGSAPSSLPGINIFALLDT